MPPAHDHGRKLEAGESEMEFRITQFPMHYFAAIQRQNFVNLSGILKRIEITPLEWRILAILSEHDRRTVNEITGIAVADRSKISRAINKMMGENLINRDHAADRRKAAICLADFGRQKYAAALPLVRDMYSRNVKGLTSDEEIVLMDLLRRIKDNVFRLEDYY